MEQLRTHQNREIRWRDFTPSLRMASERSLEVHRQQLLVVLFVHWYIPKLDNRAGICWESVSGMSLLEGEHVEHAVLGGVEHVGHLVSDGGARTTHAAGRQRHLHDARLETQRRRPDARLGATHDAHASHGAVLSLHRKETNRCWKQKNFWRGSLQIYGLSRPPGQKCKYFLGRASSGILATKGPCWTYLTTFADSLNAFRGRNKLCVGRALTPTSQRQQSLGNTVGNFKPEKW